MLSNQVILFEWYNILFQKALLYMLSFNTRKIITLTPKTIFWLQFNFITLFLKGIGIWINLFNFISFHLMIDFSFCQKKKSFTCTIKTIQHEEGEEKYIFTQRHSAKKLWTCLTRWFKYIAVQLYLKDCTFFKRSLSLQGNIIKNENQYWKLVRLQVVELALEFIS